MKYLRTSSSCYPKSPFITGQTYSILYLTSKLSFLPINMKDKIEVERLFRPIFLRSFLLIILSIIFALIINSTSNKDFLIKITRWTQPILGSEPLSPKPTIFRAPWPP